jgi:hypothetical protein
MFNELPGLKRIPVLIDNDFLISSAPVFKPTSGDFLSHDYHLVQIDSLVGRPH